MANKTLAELPVCTTPAPGNWLLIETPAAAQKLDAAWLTSPTGGGQTLANHIALASDAHDASAVSFSPAGSVAAINVQAAIEEVAADAAAAAAAAASLTPTAWTAVTFVGTWVNHGSGQQTVQYRKVGDIVYVRGQAKDGADVSTIFTLPVGFRPPAGMQFFTMDGGAPAIINVTTSGVVSNGLDTTQTNLLLNFSFSVTV